MESRKIVLNLPADLIRRAKIYATERDTTVNGMVSELLQDFFSRKSRARMAADTLLALAEEAPRFTADLQSSRREDLHVRR